MSIELTEIPGLPSSSQDIWRVRALAIVGSDGDVSDPVLAALVRWEKFYPNDYKAISKVMRLAAQQERVTNPKHVKKSDRHEFVYEIIAYTHIARLMFFYDDDGIIICTTPYEKGRGDQNAAFDMCESLRQYYLKHKNDPKTTSATQ